MKYQELKENEPLKVIEVSKHEEVPHFHFEETSNSDIIEIKRIQMRVFTDGELLKESEETSENIEEYYIGDVKYQYDVDTLKTKNIFFRNHNYVVTYLIAKELMTVGNVRGWFDVIEDVSIYLKNSKNKKALKSAIQLIKEIQNHNNKINYSSLLGMLFSQGKGFEKFETEEISKNVYSLRRLK